MFVPHRNTEKSKDECLSQRGGRSLHRQRSTGTKLEFGQEKAVFTMGGNSCGGFFSSLPHSPGAVAALSSD